MTTIALDYDGTYTEAPGFWNQAIKMSDKFGVSFVICTFRDDRYDNNLALEALSKRIPVYFTRGVAKKWWMEQFGEHVDIWIDDKPEALLFNSAMPVQGLAEWRNSQE